MNGLYRAKKEDEWVYGGLVRLDDPYGVGSKAVPYACIIPKEEGAWLDNIEEYSVDPETVGQGSGLTDKTGREMFVGDFVRTSMLYGGTIPIIGRVGFADGAFGLWWPWAGAEAFHPFCTICNTEYEIIGNMIDTPEKYENS